MDTSIDIANGNLVSTTNTNDSAFVLNLVRTGNGYFNRSGNSISMKSIRLRGLARYYYGAAGPVNSSGTLRMVVVYDKRPAGTIPTFDTIFGRTTQDGTETCEFLDALRFDNTNRFTVLKDMVVSPQPASTSVANSTVEFAFDSYVKLKGLKTQYSADSAPMTISDISTGGLYVYFRADGNVGASSFDIDSATARLRWYDNQ